MDTDKTIAFPDLKPGGEHERIMLLLRDGLPHKNFKVELPDAQGILQYQRAMSDLRWRGYAVSLALKGDDGKRDWYRWLRRDDHAEIARLRAKTSRRRPQGFDPRIFFGDGESKGQELEIKQGPVQPQMRVPVPSAARPSSQSRVRNPSASGMARARPPDQGVLF